MIFYSSVQWMRLVVLQIDDLLQYNLVDNCTKGIRDDLYFSDSLHWINLILLLRLL